MARIGDEMSETIAEPNCLKSAEGSNSAVDRLVMPDFSSTEWVKIAVTPAGGTAYYNATLDQAAVKYRHKTKLYYNRLVGTSGKWSACFLECKIFGA